MPLRYAFSVVVFATAFSSKHGGMAGRSVGAIFGALATWSLATLLARKYPEIFHSW